MSIRNVLLQAFSCLLVVPWMQAENSDAGSASELLEGCTSAITPAEDLPGGHRPEGVRGAKENLCMGYVAAFFEDPISCIPAEVTLGQTIRVVVKYLNDHPEEMHFPRRLLVSIALRQAWPCPEPDHKATSDSVDLDVVQHPWLGELAFPKEMPYGERNKLIEEQERQHPKNKSGKPKAGIAHLLAGVHSLCDTVPSSANYH